MIVGSSEYHVKGGSLISPGFYEQKSNSYHYFIKALSCARITIRVHVEEYFPSIAFRICFCSHAGKIASQLFEINS